MTKSTGKNGVKVSLRTCTACGNNVAKQELVRIVRDKQGVVSCDEGGRAAGRGAYLCANADCFNAAEKGRRLDRALKCQLSKEDYRRLEAAFRDICIKQAQIVRG